MNKERRKRLKEIADSIGEVMNDEQESRDNLPEGLEDSEKAEQMDLNVDEMDRWIDEITEFITYS